MHRLPRTHLPRRAVSTWRGALLLGAGTASATAALAASSFLLSGLQLAPVTSARLPRCSVGTLRASIVSFVGAAGIESALVRVENRSASTCVVVGFPLVRLYARVGVASATAVKYRTRLWGRPLAGRPSALSISRKAAAYFEVAYIDHPATGSGSCRLVRTMTLSVRTAPSRSIAVANATKVQLRPCAGVVQVSPFLLGNPFARA